MKIVIQKIQQIGVHPEMGVGLERRILLLNTMSAVIMACIFPYIFIFWTIAPSVSILSLAAALSYLLVFWLNHLSRYTAARQLFIAAQTPIIGIFAQLFGPAVNLENVLFSCAIYPVLLFELRDWRQMIPGITWSLAYFYALLATGHTPLPGVPRIPLSPAIELLFAYSFNGIGFFLLLAGVLYLSALYARAEAQREATITQLTEAILAQKRADEASEAKSRFLANMSHELRTPLNAIIGYTALIHESIEDGDTSAVEADLHKIDLAGRHLLAIVSDILDLSKVEAGKLALSLSPLPLRTLLDELAVACAPLLLAHTNRWHTKLSDDAPDALTTDAVRLKQILLNLVSNAAKFTHSGDITLSITRPDADHIALTVIDTGVGIAPDQQRRIFDAFIQVDDSFTRTHQGTGLGLTLSRRFAEMLGGTLTVESALGQGARFTLTLPLEPPAPRPA